MAWHIYIYSNLRYLWNSRCNQLKILHCKYCKDFIHLIISYIKLLFLTFFILKETNKFFHFHFQRSKEVRRMYRYSTNILYVSYNGQQIIINLHYHLTYTIY